MYIHPYVPRLIIKSVTSSIPTNYYISYFIVPVSQKYHGITYIIPIYVAIFIYIIELKMTWKYVAFQHNPAIIKHYHFLIEYSDSSKKCAVHMLQINKTSKEKPQIRALDASQTF